MSKTLITRILIFFSILGILSLLCIPIFAVITRSSTKDTVDIFRGSIEIVALVFGAGWLLFKFFEYREFMDWIQLDIDKNLYKLSFPVEAEKYNYKKGESEPERTPLQSYTYAIEVVLRFTNTGKVRFRLYNIIIGINTMRLPSAEAKIDEDSGYLRLTRIFTSGNIVRKIDVHNKPPEETSFYYIEPGVQQEITYLALISQPQELLQVVAKFNLTQKRMSPEEIDPKDMGATTIGLHPHTAARTFQVDQ